MGTGEAGGIIKHRGRSGALPVSLVLLCLAAVFLLGLAPPNRETFVFDDGNGILKVSYLDTLIGYRLIGLPLLLAGFLLSRAGSDREWWKSYAVLSAQLLILFFTPISGLTNNANYILLSICLGLGALGVPILLCRYWLKKPLDFTIVRGKWTIGQWLWIPGTFLLSIVVFHYYFRYWTPDLHLQWYLAEQGTAEVSSWKWRIFWGCNLVGIFDELAFINIAFQLIRRHFSYPVSALGAGVFFSSFLYDMAFHGPGPLITYYFALIQTSLLEWHGSLLYIVILHLIVDTVLFAYIVANYYHIGFWQAF
jgi:hypothetical protein